MKILVNEDKFISLMINEMINEYNISDGNAFHNPYHKKLENRKERLKKLVATNGVVMTSIENGKDYIVYEIYALAELIGARYALCRAIKDNEPKGAVMVKPFESFRIKNY